MAKYATTVFRAKPKMTVVFAPMIVVLYGPAGAPL